MLIMQAVREGPRQQAGPLPRTALALPSTFDTLFVLDSVRHGDVNDLAQPHDLAHRRTARGREAHKVDPWGK